MASPQATGIRRICHHVEASAKSAYKVGEHQSLLLSRGIAGECKRACDDQSRGAQTMGYFATAQLPIEPSDGDSGIAPQLMREPERDLRKFLLGHRQTCSMAGLHAKEGRFSCGLLSSRPEGRNQKKSGTWIVADDSQNPIRRASATFPELFHVRLRPWPGRMDDDQRPPWDVLRCSMVSFDWHGCLEIPPVLAVARNKLFDGSLHRTAHHSLIVRS